MAHMQRYLLALYFSTFASLGVPASQFPQGCRDGVSFAQDRPWNILQEEHLWIVLLPGAVGIVFFRKSHNVVDSLKMLHLNRFNDLLYHLQDSCPTNRMDSRIILVKKKKKKHPLIYPLGYYSFGSILLSFCFPSYVFGIQSIY